MTAWTDFIKKYAQENKISYGCALSTPDCSKQYYEQKNKPKLIRMKKDEDYKKNKYRFIKRIRNVELDNMGLEDINVIQKLNPVNLEKKKLEEDLFTFLKKNPPAIYRHFKNDTPNYRNKQKIEYKNVYLNRPVHKKLRLAFNKTEMTRLYTDYVLLNYNEQAPIKIMCAEGPYIAKSVSGGTTFPPWTFSIYPPSKLALRIEKYIEKYKLKSNDILFE